ncbi:unnamed protein product [marine sediment metagenome]|uniref:Uncharacterized protein n=1 Tax=marine sediment metagenome TaxID=412755 RepID=X1JBE7_9ZZZZ
MSKRHTLKTRARGENATGSFMRFPVLQLLDLASAIVSVLSVHKKGQGPGKHREFCKPLKKGADAV